MGAQLVEGGATFKTWAPSASEVHLVGDINNWQRSESSLLNRSEGGYWTGFFEGFGEFNEYKFYIVGPAGKGYKRDPYARELTRNFPHSNCIARSPYYPWVESDYRPPAFNDVVNYQLHVGTFHTPNLGTWGGTFLDVVSRIEYFSDLGINCLQLLPIQEFRTQFSLGYNGTDYFSPEMDFSLPDHLLPPYLEIVNRLLEAKGQPPLEQRWIEGSVNQLKTLINLCHLYGIAVIFDVVYNHAGGGFDAESIYFYDFQQSPFDNPDGETIDNNRSRYFTDRGHAGGLSFSIWQQEVKQYLIDNAVYFMDEYRIDGYRYDQVSVLVEENANNGWRFCQDMNNTLDYLYPYGLDIAEYWPTDPYIAKSSDSGGADFDASLHDGLRDAIRKVITEASFPGDHGVDLDLVASRMRAFGFEHAWKAVQNIENHDEVYRDRGQRIPRLADSNNPRSWYARSRSRVAMSLLMTAPGIPMIFMGQEFLEDKQWADDLSFHADKLINWSGLDGSDRHSSDFLEFSKGVISLRRQTPALRGEGYQTIHVNSGMRVIVYQRWGDSGSVAVVIASLNDETLDNYQIGFPHAGFWNESFNSDYYDHLPNPEVRGNDGGVFASSFGIHGMPASAMVTIPANSAIVFTR